MLHGYLRRMTAREGANAGESVFTASSPWRAPLSIFGVYLLLTLIFTYPLIAHLGTHIPGGNVDEGAFLWNIWWMKHALLDLHANPLTTDMLFYPLGVNLTLYTLTPLNGLLALPLTLVAGPIVAVNVLTIAAFALSGLAMYLLAVDVLSNPSRQARLAAFIAGLLYAFASGRFLYAALGQYDYIHVQWLPLTVLFLLRTVYHRGRWSPLLAGLFAACAGLTEMNFVVFLVVFALCLFTYLLVWQRSLFGRVVLRRLAAALTVFGVGFGPLGLAVVAETLRSDYLIKGWGLADRLLIDLLGPLVPSPLHPLVGAWASSAASRFSDINFGFVGYLPLALIILVISRSQDSGVRPPGATTHQQPRPSLPMTDALQPGAGMCLWIITTLVFFLLSLGPLLHVNGHFDFDIDGLTVNVPLPYIIIHYLPILKGARVPGRFAIMTTLAAAVLVAAACRIILRRLRQVGWQTAVAVLLSMIILAENMAVPLPLSNATVPEPYRTIAAEPGDFSIIQIPLGWRDGFGTVGRERTMLQTYQSVHNKRILGGNTSRSPGYVLSYFAQMPVIRSIVALEEGRSVDAATMAADRAQAATVLGFLDVRYIVVHGEYVGGPVDDYIQSVLPARRLATGSGQVENSFWHLGDDGKWIERRVENAGWELYGVSADQPRPATFVDVGSPGAELYLAAGWSRAETMSDISFSWAVAAQALVLLRLDRPHDATLALRAAPFSYPGAPTQRLTVAVNGRTIGSVQMQQGWQDYRFVVEASLLRGGINHIWLSFDHLASPAQVLGSSDRRTLAVAVDWVTLE